MLWVTWQPLLTQASDGNWQLFFALTKIIYLQILLNLQFNNKAGLIPCLGSEPQSIPDFMLGLGSKLKITAIVRLSA